MPKVPQFNHKPIRSIYNPTDTEVAVSLKQKNYIMTLCERRKLPLPSFECMTKGQAAQLISSMANSPLAVRGMPSLPPALKCSQCSFVAKTKHDFNEHYSLEH